MDALKLAHVSCVALSLSGFALRGWGMWRQVAWLEARTVRILPHLVDTGLLATGVWLALRIQQYPFTHAWLSAKLAALIGYILLGSIALRRGRSARVRRAAFIAALALAAYLVAVARTRDVLPGF